MKKLFFFVSLMFSFLISHSQTDWELSFDDNTWVNYIFIDTINYPDNIWQVGSPEKTIFDESASLPNAIVTDTINSYPTNNSSVFYFKYKTDDTFLGDWEASFLLFSYKIDTDENFDFGKVEFSADNGQTWINYLTDTVYNDCYSWTNSLSFSGSSNEWQIFYLDINYNYCFDIELGDTVQYRFTFVSDGINTNKDGWMIDNINFWDIIEGVNNHPFQSPIISVYPNPSCDYVIFQTTDLPYSEIRDKIDIIITNFLGDVVAQIPVTGAINRWDCSQANPGIYFYQFKTNEKIYSGKFLIAR